MIFWQENYSDFNIFFEDNVSFNQHTIFLLSKESNFCMLKSKQHFLIKSFYARVLALRNFGESDVSANFRLLSSKEKFNIVSFLYHRKNLCKYYDFYVTKNKGTSFSFDFFMIYSFCFLCLFKFSILPFLETKLDKFLFIFRPYKRKLDSVLEVNDIILNDYNKLWFIKVSLSDLLNSISKLWLLRNFPVRKIFLNFYFKQKHLFFCKTFHLIIFNYLLKGLVRIMN